jgi:peptidoglycan hydrolase CwlO-like protein
MKQLMNNKILSCMLATIFSLTLSLTANAEDMKLEEAKAEIERLEQDNASLKEELDLYDKKISEHRGKLEEYDKKLEEFKMNMENSE